MRQSEAHQSVRMIKFLDVLGRYEAAEFSQLDAANLLGVGERTFRRWRQRYEDDGEIGLLDRRLGKVSGKRVPADRAAEVEALYRSRYAGFTAKHFHEHLARDHGFAWGYTWTKTFLHDQHQQSTDRLHHPPTSLEARVEARRELFRHRWVVMHRPSPLSRA